MEPLTREKAIQNVRDAGLYDESTNRALPSTVIPGVGGAVSRGGFISQDGTTPISVDKNIILSYNNSSSQTIAKVGFPMGSWYFILLLSRVKINFSGSYQGQNIGRLDQ